MKVREAMTSEVGFCQPNMTLTNAAMIMWQRDCGVVPIVDEKQRVIGMITDRDICIAVATKNRLASEIRISEIISGKVKSCQPDESLEDALKTMKKQQLRRLPVTGKDGILLGVVSISDLLRAGKGKEIKKKLFAALREISNFRPISLHEIASEDDTLENVSEDSINSRKNADQNSETDNFTESVKTNVNQSSETDKPETNSPLKSDDASKILTAEIVKSPAD